MKFKFSFVLIVLVTIVFACKKNLVSPGNSTILTGNWEFRSSIGGERLAIIDSSGNGNIYSFGNTTFKYFEKNIARDSGIYTITQTADLYTGKLSPAVSLKSSSPVFFSVRGDTLTFYDESFEPTVNTYVKISK